MEKEVRKDALIINQQCLPQLEETFASSVTVNDVVSKYMKNFCILKRKRHVTQ